jgi:hypothetical protein
MVCAERKESIKMNKICETNPILEILKMNLTNYMINGYSNNSNLLAVQKRTQSNPILSHQRRSQNPSNPNKAGSNPTSGATVGSTCKTRLTQSYGLTIRGCQKPGVIIDLAVCIYFLDMKEKKWISNGVA